MPLVSGVCRTASAPMLSHGGSRLNASKPEANPKTSCPSNNIFHSALCVLTARACHFNVVRASLWRQQQISVRQFTHVVRDTDGKFWSKRGAHMRGALCVCGTTYGAARIPKDISGRSQTHLIQRFCSHFRVTQKILHWIFTLHIESPLKQAWPSGCLVGAKYIKNSREFFTQNRVQKPVSARRLIMSACCACATRYTHADSQNSAYG